MVGVGVLVGVAEGEALGVEVGDAPVGFGDGVLVGAGVALTAGLGVALGEGVGVPDICVGTVGEGETKIIFIAPSSGTGEITFLLRDNNKPTRTITTSAPITRSTIAATVFLGSSIHLQYYKYHQYYKYYQAKQVLKPSVLLVVLDI